jgi:(p)ppGpp synthase/HD superfamily hydrolase
MLGFLYLLLKPKQKVEAKSKTQKQEEIYEEYKQIMDKELSRFVDDKPLFKQRKTALLKRFAQELNNNLFFDVEETRELINKLIKYEINGQ